MSLSCSGGWWIRSPRRELAEPFVSEAQIDDLLAAPVEGERAIDVADGDVDVLDSSAGHRQVDYLRPYRRFHLPSSARQPEALKCG